MTIQSFVAIFSVIEEWNICPTEPKLVSLLALPAEVAVTIGSMKASWTFIEPKNLVDCSQIVAKVLLCSSFVFPQTCVFSLHWSKIIEAEQFYASKVLWFWTLSYQRHNASQCAIKTLRIITKLWHFFVT